MREVISRRFARLPPRPEGTQGFAKGHRTWWSWTAESGQLRAALKGLNDQRAIAVPLAALAKREEELFSTNSPHPIRLPPTSEGLYLLQRIRDEAHRSAVGYHASLRSRSSRRSALDEVPGVGPVRRRQLLRHFGSLAQLRGASAEENRQGSGNRLSDRDRDPCGGLQTSSARSGPLRRCGPIRRRPSRSADCGNRPKTPLAAGFPARGRRRTR